MSLMKTRLGGYCDISLARRIQFAGDRQQIDQAISFANGYISLKASIAIAFRFKAESVH
ncbi:hypothetical protein [Nostoc sp.]|uniref:hypothetical protein n=1 Tax=Nostoc sp. TaxID=1180 RepID=UPI002FF5E346